MLGDVMVDVRTNMRLHAAVLFRRVRCNVLTTGLIKSFVVKGVLDV